MNSKIVFTFGMAVVCLFFVAGSAAAQWKDNMGGNWNNPTSASIGNIINDRLWNRVFAKARARDNASVCPSTNRSVPAPRRRKAMLWR